ncbi:MAG: hypothetical protein ACFE96_18460 [Candidatus Hermodarchaeota archaeon]
MSQDQDIRECFHILDIIKIKLNEIVIKGIDSVSSEDNSELWDLKGKLKEMNFITLSDLLESFLKKMEKLTQKPIPITLKQDISIEILRIIAVTRMLEKIMTVESVTKTLKPEV